MCVLIVQFVHFSQKSVFFIQHSLHAQYMLFMGYYCCKQNHYHSLSNIQVFTVIYLFSNFKIQILKLSNSFIPDF